MHQEMQELTAAHAQQMQSCALHRRIQPVALSLYFKHNYNRNYSRNRRDIAVRPTGISEQAALKKRLDAALLLPKTDAALRSHITPFFTTEIE